MSLMASQITSLTIVHSTVYSGTDQRKHQSSASLAFVRGIYRWPVNFPHKGPVTRKMFPFDDVIMIWKCWYHSLRRDWRWSVYQFYMIYNKNNFCWLVRDILIQRISSYFIIHAAYLFVTHRGTVIFSINHDTWKSHKKKHNYISMFNINQWMIA